ncbi:hypothetical protein CFP65_6028 [Kitasatospora sp. MMS16-BH015]|uniref:hypothetical protein n=1 Tax=Kitasatospora sp. MMS16-BH015 TaxID=2018025 RepID=UPI000CA3CBE8|nr:hypothetical protein [Kitasatospora sp. MMS16-BH015]AUG80700.1 hypothetical protein CFP65_6028 [Kitasatospora sp. MMS16-BH015]
MTTAVRPAPTARRTGHAPAAVAHHGCALPPLHILAFDPADLPPGRRAGIPAADLADHHAQLAVMRRAAAEGDSRQFALTATAAALLTVRHRPRPVVERVTQRLQLWGAIGLQAEQDSSLLGLLYAPDEADLDARVARARAGLLRLGIHRTWRFDAG